MNSGDKMVGADEQSQVFISYSHDDREFAEKLATSLHFAGEDVWWDKWEINPGDSLIKKIFEEGLSRARAFIIVLSPHSVRSKWVREELDVATIRRIEGVTRVIPVLREPVDIPTSLRSLMWVDLREDFDAGVKRIINAIHGISSKPARSQVSPTIRQVPASHGGFSRAATAVATFMLQSVDLESGLEEAFAGDEIASGVSLEPQVINDGVDELSDAGLVRTIKTLGTSPFDFYQAEPTYVLFREFAQFLTYDPDEDIRIVAAAVASRDRIDGPGLTEITSLPPGRLNRAVAYLEDFGLANVLRWLGSSPFTFGEVRATRRTRQFVD